MSQKYEEFFPAIEFAGTSSNPLDKRLELMTTFLALIKVLEIEKFNFSEIRGLCLQVAEALVRPKNKFQAWKKRLPAKFAGTWIASLLLPLFHKKVNKKGHQDGFRAEIITDKAQTHGLGYGINILECGICQLFAKHQASQYTAILCEVDELTSSLAGLELIRSGTIANGAKICDFRFRKAKRKPDGVQVTS